MNGLALPECAKLVNLDFRLFLSISYKSITQEGKEKENWDKTRIEESQFDDGIHLVCIIELLNSFFSLCASKLKKFCFETFSWGRGEEGELHFWSC